MTQGIEHEESPGDEELQVEAEPVAAAAVGEPDVAEESSPAPDAAPDAATDNGAPGMNTDQPEDEESEAELREEPPAEEPEGEAGPAEEPAPDAEAAGPEPAEPDDLEAAIAEAAANLEAEATFDDIAPGTVAAAQGGQPEADGDERGRDSVPTWPFVVYDAVWLTFASILVWQFEQLPAGQAVFESPLYEAAVLGGVALTVVGPVLILATWIGSWGKPGASKGGLFVSALIKGAIATAVGVALWWVALMVLDQLRLGRLL